jgi:hypothetical protein
MFVCRLFNNIEFRADPLLYTVALTPQTILLTAETNKARVGKIFMRQRISRTAAKYNKGLTHRKRAMNRDYQNECTVNKL